MVFSLNDIPIIDYLWYYYTLDDYYHIIYYHFTSHSHTCSSIVEAPVTNAQEVASCTRTRQWSSEALPRVPKSIGFNGLSWDLIGILPDFMAFILTERDWQRSNEDLNGTRHGPNGLLKGEPDIHWITIAMNWKWIWICYHIP